jgi:hypothetical protein
MKPEELSSEILLKVSFPVWFRSLYAVGGPYVVLLVCLALLRATQDEFTLLTGLKIGFLVLLVGLGASTVPIFFSTIYVTRSGIRRWSPFCGTKILSWDQIKTVARPRLGIPGDAAYIVSKTDEKIIVGRSMTGYRELVQLIEDNAPEVKVKGLADNLTLSKSANSWRGILIFLGLFIAYVVIRKLAGW